MDEFRLEIIRTWFLRAKPYTTGTIDGLNKQPFAEQLFYADGLIYCSIAYEAFIFGMFKRPTVAENRKKLSKAFKNILQSDKLPTGLQHAIDELYIESNEKHIEDMSGRGKPVWIKNKKNLDNILEVIYRVRSNLFHGGKELSSTRNFKLVKYSFIALYNIMERILKKEKIIR